MERVIAIGNDRKRFDKNFIKNMIYRTIQSHEQIERL